MLTSMAHLLAAISEREIAERLYADWAICIEKIYHLHLGTSSYTGTFRADSGDAKYFVKLARTVSETGISVSLLLADRGIPAVAPILSSDGNAWEAIAGYQMLVYPMLNGVPIVPETTTELDWRSLGLALRAVHDTPLTPELRDVLPSDDRMFRPWGQEFVSGIGTALSGLGERADRSQQELADLWLQQGNFAEEFFSIVKAQGEAALATSPSLSLCHSDFQPQNILKSSRGTIHLIDWEGAMWAPREKDLIFVPVEYRELFEKGYGPLHLNEPVMEYETANWLLQDLLDCVDRILFKAAIGKGEKQWALDLMRSILPRMTTLVARIK